MISGTIIQAWYEGLAPEPSTGFAMRMPTNTHVCKIQLPFLTVIKDQNGASAL